MSRLSVKEKVGYSLGDLSANLVFQTLMMFLLVFYTDVFGIEPGIAGTIIFVGGIIGAVFNIVMGAIADRTSTKWGKFRPWILWTALPFGVMAVLAFTTPDFGPGGKIAYASITYVLLLIVYSANNLPYSALSGVMTGDMVERTSLSSYRFIAVTIAQFITLVLLLPLVDFLGDGNESLGYQRSIIIFAIIAVVFFLITFFSTKERISPAQSEKTSIKEDLKDLMANRPWILMFVLTTILFVGLALRGGMLVYFFKDYVAEESLVTVMESLGFTNPKWLSNAGSYGYSIFNTVGIIGALIGIACSKPMAKRFGKRDAFIFGLAVTAVLQALFIFYEPYQVTAIYATHFFISFFYGITTPLLWAMIADVADYSEWKNNRRATGMVFSAIIFGLKAGLGLGGAVAGIVLSQFGYDADLAQQSHQALLGIRLSVSVFTAVLFMAGCAVLLFYKINKAMELKIQKELEVRRIKE
jgi:Na+/melibiose symporter-like transporter